MKKTRTRGYWNLRVIVFDQGAGSKSAVHEVYYSADGTLKGYSSHPAVLMWTGDDEPGTGQRGLKMFRRALAEPAINAVEFAL